MKTRKEVLKESQHIVPQVYLREFGFLKNNQQWSLSVLRRPSPYIKTKSIKSFLCKENHYDIPVTDPYFKRINEKLINKAFEDKYPKLLKELKTEILTNDLLVQLVEIAISILCRTDYVRQAINEVLLSNGNEDIIEEITFFLEDKSKLMIQSQIKKLPKRFHLNALMAFLLNHILEIVKRNKFRVSIIKTNGLFWFTCDNPAMLIDGFSSDVIFDYNTEIIFPYSKEYLVYIYNPEKENRFFQINSPFTALIIAQEDDIKKVAELVFTYDTEWIIFPHNMGRTSLAN